MPGPAQKRLSPAERRQLEAALAKIEKAEADWANLTRRLGISAVAREMGLTPGAILQRVRKFEDR